MDNALRYNKRSGAHASDYTCRCKYCVCYAFAKCTITCKQTARNDVCEHFVRNDVCEHFARKGDNSRETR